MTIQLVVPNAEPKCPRGDRLQEEPSAKNAQGLFPPEACIFVGNLSTKVPTETLAEDLKSVFTQFGACHVKIKQDKKKGLPGAFVQFERVEDASAALANEESTVLHDRPLRIERAKGRRTACLGLRSLQPITAQDVVTALGGRGSLEVYTIEPQQTGIQTWTDVAKVTFAFVDDCRDAIKHFQKDDQYYLHLLDMDGSPLIQGPVQGPGYAHPRPKPFNGPFPRGGNFHPRNTTNRQYRNGNGNGNFNHRGGYRGGFSKPHHPPMNNESMPPHGAYIPNPPIVMTGMPFHNENHPQFYHPPPGPPPPPGPSGYGPPPIMSNGPPGYRGPHPPPEAFCPPMTNGPFIVGGLPSWSPPAPNFYPGPFVPDNGYISPQPGMNGPNGYFGPVGPMGYGEPWAGQPTFTPSPPHINNHKFGHRKAPAPVKPRDVMANDIPKEKVVDDQSPENDSVGGVPLNPKTPEKAPRLIRVYRDDDEDDDLKNGSEKGSPVNGVVVSVQEITDDDSATEADSRSRSRSRSLSRDKHRSQSQSLSRSRSHSHSGSRSRSVSASGIRLSSDTDSAPSSDSDKSKKTKKTKRKKTVRWSHDTPMDDTKSPSPSNSTTSTTSSRTCASPTQKPVNTLPDTKTGISIEEYVRREAHGRGLSEDDLQDVIQSLKAEQLLKNGHIPKEEQVDKDKEQEKRALPAGTDGQLVTDTDSRGSQNGSVARKRSVKRSVKAA